MVTINTLNGGNITITTGGSAPATHEETWYKYDGDTEWRTVSISGRINGIPALEGPPQPTTQIPNITNVVALEIGTEVTSIGNCAFWSCSSLTSVTIPDSVTGIGSDVFDSCENLTSVTFLGKTIEQVQNIEDEYGNANKYYPWGITNTSIITVV